MEKITAKNLLGFLRKHGINILGIGGIVFTVVSYYFPNNQNPNLVYYQRNVVDVFRINDSINDFKVLFKDKDLRKQKLNLKVYTIKLVNNGHTDISTDDYDKNVPFGLNFKNGFVIGVDSVESNDHDIYRELHPNYRDSTKITFNNVLIKQGKYIILKVIVIHKSNLYPNIEPLGKISNTNIVYTTDKEGGNTNWFVLFKLLFVFGIGIVGLSYFSKYYEDIKEFIIRWYRKGVMKRLYENNKYRYIPKDLQIQSLLIKIYSILGRKEFVEFLNTFLDNKRLNEKWVEEKENKRSIERFDKLYEQKKISIGSQSYYGVEYKSYFLEVIDILIENERYGFIQSGELIIRQNVLNETYPTLELFK